MNGADGIDLAGMRELECEIVRSGFPKVYYAQRFDIEWYYKELHRLHRTDSENRFVLVGFGAATKQLDQLACRVTADGIPLDAVVFVDPIGWNGDPAEPPPYRTLVIRSHNWRGSPRILSSELLKVTQVGHFHLPPHPSVVAAIHELLVESAMRVPISRPPVDCLPMIDETRPIPRPYDEKRVPPAPPGWRVLCPENLQ
jgi:hypothetical protein